MNKGLRMEDLMIGSNFTDTEILHRFQESLPKLLKDQEGETDHYFGRLYCSTYDQRVTDLI
jgi:hypothetical protein